MSLLLAAILDTSKYVDYLGTRDVNLFWSCIFFGYLGVLIMILLDVSKRNPTSKWSPVAFSFRFFITDNLKRIILNVLLVAVCIRFIPQLTGKDMSQWLALLIGIGSDTLGAMILKKKKALFSDDTVTVTTTTPVDTNTTVNVQSSSNPEDKNK